MTHSTPHITTITDSLQLFESARLVAHKAHGRDMRADGKTLYITHPLEVARLFMEHWQSDPKWSQWTKGLDSTDMWRGMALAMLHDVAEDTSTTILDLRAAGFGGIEDELSLLTRASGQSYLQYLLAIKHYRSTCTLPFLVKLCDIEHNSKDAEGLPPARRKWALTKYEMATWILHN